MNEPLRAPVFGATSLLDPGLVWYGMAPVPTKVTVGFATGQLTPGRSTCCGSCVSV
jgi:hypothetical protein